ncbi:MAG TPA: hypothetical protein PKC28_05285, partial [Bdellovibrionales bacterium]|nr:hypothetical protein [Bdellovibrionales bacterium]
FDVFVAALAYLRSAQVAAGLGPDSANILELLVSDSPLSTKQLKAAAELEGRSLESAYNRAMRPLWNHLLLVGFGEFEDSSFPSLGIGATQTLFEELWGEAEKLTPGQGERVLRSRLGDENPFMKWLVKVRRTSPVSTTLDKNHSESYI